MKKIISFIFSLTILLSASCKKNDDSVPLTDRATALLGQWEYAAIMTDRAIDLNGDNTSNIDLFNTQELPQCAKDDVTTFTESGPSGKAEYNVTENNLACNENDPFSFIEEDFWVLTNNNSAITFEEREPFRIMELTDNSLIVESDSIFDGQAYIMTITFKKR